MMRLVDYKVAITAMKAAKRPPTETTVWTPAPVNGTVEPVEPVDVELELPVAAATPEPEAVADGAEPLVAEPADEPLAAAEEVALAEAGAADDGPDEAEAGPAEAAQAQTALADCWT